jgi:sugar transferase (PEP-CTERM system associated)
MVFYGVILVVVDALLAIIALLSAALLRFGYDEIATYCSDSQAVYMLIILVWCIIFSSHLMEVYDLDRAKRKREIFINIGFGIITSFFMLSVVYYLFPETMLGRGVLFLSLAIFCFLQSCWHMIFARWHNSPQFSQKVLILGNGELARQMGELAESNSRNFTLAGYALCNKDDLKSQSEAQGANLVFLECVDGMADNLLDTARRVRADIIVVALSERRGVFPLQEVLRCKLNGINVLDAPSFYEMVNGKLMLESITPSWFIFSTGFMRTNLFSLCKRAVDVILSMIGLILTMPFFPIIALAIKLDSPGPILFSQIRVGNHEELFRLYKFRSMAQDAEAKSGAVWAVKNDNRVTKLGRFLRSSRIDEIPQLINVFKGDMSFVGPRPERPEFVEKLKKIVPYYSKRHFIKPGLTGWAQVRYPYGASVEDALEKLRYDLFYTKNIGPFLDTLIFMETIKVVLFGRGAR